jgi:hypothetical protein
VQVDAESATDRGHPPIRADHQLTAQLIDDIVMLVAHHRALTRLDVNVTDTANHGGPGHRGSPDQRLTGLRMPDMQHARRTGQDLVQRRGGGLGLGLRRIGHLVVGHRPRHVASARLQQGLLQIEPEQLSHTPAGHPLAAHLVPIGGLAFEHHDLIALPGHHGGQRRPSDPATYDDRIN